MAVFADLVVMLGLPKSMGEIYGLLFASAAPLSFTEIEHKLGLSKGSVSQGLRALREVGAVNEAVSERAKGVSENGTRDEIGGNIGEAPVSRGARWVATTELRKLIGTLLRERLTPYVVRQDKHIQAAEAALAQEAGRVSSDQRSILANRLEKLQTWQSRARSVLPVVAKML